MSVFKIRALNPAEPPKPKLSDEQRAEAKYAANRISNLLGRDEINASVEGRPFWVDVHSRLQQLATTGELV